MECQACQATEGLEVCLFCGRHACARHRGAKDGVTACTQCVKATARPKPTPRAAADRQGPAASRTERVEAGVPSPAVQTAPPPLREPPSPWRPVGWGLGAAVPSALYLWFFLGWLAEGPDGAPEWVPAAGTAAGALVAFGGVWLIAKTRSAE